MKQLYLKKSAFTFCLAIAVCFMLKAQSSSVYFDLDACDAHTSTGQNMNYSEFTGQINNSSCATLSVLGGFIYRNNPAINKHSCTPGVDGDPAMCIGSNPACTFTPGSDQALRIDLLVSPDADGSATLSELSFYEQGPAQFNWIDGPSGPNNYPTLFGIRILKNGVEVYLSTGLPTELTWNLNTFNFSGLPEFTVNQPTTFNIELLPYCPVGNGALVSAWDIDEIRITADCCDTPAGGVLSGGPFEFCVGDSIPDHVSGVVLTGQTGPNSQWVITDDANNILNLQSSIESVNFDVGGSGVYLIWHISYNDGLTGLVVGNDLLSDLNGCFGLSNALTVIRNQVAGGALSGGPFEFCVGDGIPDHVSGVILSGNAGEHSQWVVTNDLNTILSLPSSLDGVNFDNADPGICLIWNISYFDNINGLVPGNNLLNDISGCFDISNSITVIRNDPEGGSLTGGPFEFCVGDSIPDHVSGIMLSGNVGANSQWVVSNNVNTILSFPVSPEVVNFDDGGPGICLIWHISSFYTLSGLAVGNNLMTDVSGCFALSNPITVVRYQPEGGALTGGPFEFCVGDGIPDHVTGVVLSGNSGSASLWVITNGSNTILNLPASLDSVNFDGAGPGSCLIWNISYSGAISGLMPGNNLLTGITGCFDLSNSITVIRNDPEGGSLTGGPFEFCVGDSIPDHVSGISLSGNSGPNSQWVVTDEGNNILSLPVSPLAVNFDGGGPGICLIWHISYFNPLSGLTVGNNLLNDVSGCFELSNSLTVVRNQPAGGAFTGGPLEFCVGDSTDFTNLVLTGNVGQYSQLVVTNSVNTIMGLPESLEEIDFTGSGQGTFFIWNISYFDPLTGLVIGNNLLSGVEGCLGLSNAITVVFSQTEGGVLTGGPFTFCVGDSIPDHVSGVSITGNSGANSQWVVTNDVNTILGLPDSPEEVDFDGAGPGACLIWHVSYNGALSGLTPGNNLLTDLNGCFALSNSITVNRNQPEGGELFGGPFEFCVGDTIPDHVSGVELVGNVGGNSQYVVTDSVYNILSLPDTPEEVDFNNAPPGTCLIVHVSYYGDLTGLEAGNNLMTDLEGCFSLSNALPVVRVDCEGFGGDPVFEMKISPNPVKDFVTLKMLYTGEDMPMVQVFDASGRLCFKQHYAPGDDMTISMSKFAEGCYFIRVQSALGHKTESIMVIK